MIQLVSTGEQDVFLTGKPEVSYFKKAHHTHTNFSVESIEQSFTSGVGFGKKSSCTLSRKGDLVSWCYLELRFPELETVGLDLEGGTIAYTEGLAHALVESCEVEIGGRVIDKHYSWFYESLDELNCPESKRRGYREMVSSSSKDKVLYLPLRFWFNKSLGLALPLVSLRYHEIRFNFAFRQYSELVQWRDSNGSLKYHDNKFKNSRDVSISLWVDYIFLDSAERLRFVEGTHEYLIDQLQYTGGESVTLQPHSEMVSNVTLNFNHPCKEIMFFANARRSLSSSSPFDFGENIEVKNRLGDVVMRGVEYVSSATLQLNGEPRFERRPGSYFRLVVPFTVHRRIPTRNLYCYSFSLVPESDVSQPMGTLNFSRIENAVLQLTHPVSSRFDFNPEYVPWSPSLPETLSSINSLGFVDPVFPGTDSTGWDFGYGVFANPGESFGQDFPNFGQGSVLRLSNVTFNTKQQSHTLSVWINPGVLGVSGQDRYDVVGYGFPGAAVPGSTSYSRNHLRFSELALVLNGSSNYTLRWTRGGGNADLSQAAPVPGMEFQYNVWTHVVLVYDDSQQGSVYVNGDLVQTHMFPLPFHGSFGQDVDSSLTLGVGSSNDVGYKGLVGPVAFYDRALSNEDVNSLYWYHSVGYGIEEAPRLPSHRVVPEPLLVHVFAITYNVLRIADGLSGLLFSN